MIQHEENNFVKLYRTAGCGPACPVVWEGGVSCPPIPMYARHGRSLGGESPPWAMTRRTTSKGQLRMRERTWGGSLDAKPGLDEQELRRRHGTRGKLAQDSEAQTGQSDLV